MVIPKPPSWRKLALDRLLSDEQRLGNLTVGLSFGDLMAHPPLRHGQRVRPGQLEPGAAVGDLEFAQQRRDMTFDRANRNEEVGRDLGVRQVLGNRGQHLGLSRRNTDLGQRPLTHHLIIHRHHGRRSKLTLCGLVVGGHRCSRRHSPPGCRMRTGRTVWQSASG